MAGYISVPTIFRFLSLCVLVNIPDKVNAARILGFFPSASPSHLIIHCAVAETLAAAGHNVTVVAPTKNFFPHAKYEYIETGAPIYSKEFLDNLMNKPVPIYKRFMPSICEIARLANETMSNAKVKKFLTKHGPGSFDLIILGYLWNEFHLALGVHFECPVIISFMVRPVFSLQSLMGNLPEAAYVPTLFSELKQPLSFWERVKNFVIAAYEHYILQALVDAELQKYHHYNFPPDRYPSLDEMRKNVSLAFVNHHFSQGPIRPNVPNLIEIGGIQIKEKPNPLPADIAKALDESKEGVIYFSLGSNVQGKHLTREKAQIMFNVISKLSYKVLWKWGDSDFPGQSANIIYKSWLPQDDILAHPNIKLFITHGGMGSVVESQYHGVPMVGIPLFGDQPSNIANMQNSGFGISVDYVTLTEKSLGDAINEVLNNPKYGDAVRTFSRLYRDRPMTARQSVVYWTEYVLRHKGARHMQSPAVHMNRWQLMSLDVIAFLLAIMASVVFVFVQLCRCICCRRKKVVQVTMAKKKK